MYRFVIELQNARMVVIFFYNEEKVGEATLINDADILRLKWIEIVDKHKSKGLGTMLMDHITDNILNDNQLFQISVVDEATLPFYFSFFDKRNIQKETMFDWVQDGDVHPEINVPKGSLKNVSANKFKASF